MENIGSIDPGLRAALEFEEQRLGVPLVVRCRHLLDIPTEAQFRPVVVLTLHTGSAEESFPVLLPGERLEVHAPAYVTEDQRVYGYRDRRGGVAALAGVTGNRVHVYFDLDLLFRHPERIRRFPRNGARPTGSPAALLADLVLGPALARAARNIRAYSWRAERNAYARQVLRAREQQADDWRRAIRDNDVSIEDKTWQLRTLVEKNTQLRDQVRAFESLTRRRRVRLAREDHAQIVSMLGKGLRVLRVENSILKATTAPVEIQWDGVTYRMGSFEIHVPLATGRVTIHPEEGCTHVEGFFHPHVNSDGIPCLGNIGGTLAQLIGERHFAQVLTLLLEFLRSYNPDNPYIRLERWDPDWEDEDDHWERCYDGASFSDCATCDDWDCPHREGAETRCYDNADTQDCIACAGCNRHRDAIQNCRGDSDPEDCVSCDTDCPYSNDEGACFTSHDGERCDECHNHDCNHFNPEDDDDENPS